MAARTHWILRHVECATRRHLSTSPTVSISLPSMFRPKRDIPASTEPLNPSDFNLARSEVQGSSFLGTHDKAALQKIIDKGLGKIAIPYNPPADVTERIRGVFEEAFGALKVEQPLQLRFPNRASKFHFLASCERVFNYTIPNSHLYEIRTVEDVVRFYQTPVAGTNGLTQFQQVPDLPPNLHIRYDYYDEDEDPIYNGVTADPHVDKIPMGLREKKLYKPVKAERDWPKSFDVHRIKRGHWPNPAHDQHFPD
ncbi:hypothetical protein RvY_15391 [Ramazzottius varieornatus]|uniref:Large ribosomal subunit protein mL50 n=1 Tax=Ramazzottius varieornatus TaxID=947166 RepID=A0A1D1VUR2_RAMVA|nr:hypothetical protein RvY_15391 [Ramazzottius varieornatus]